MHLCSDALNIGFGRKASRARGDYSQINLNLLGILFQMFNSIAQTFQPTERRNPCIFSYQIVGEYVRLRSIRAAAPILY
ncbi:hypothetical protein ACZ87_00798 [Candidatus Erwinia dacicola]|uniref:Uncharacterized protein n=1 Tax=Candidatus Erwinia dacicola TaxID=252393 RepID=A0A2T6MR56_9GAMM|nr:hypothetical protein ACZ87_00856 [Candidatus Erwinia dacicola]RAP72382.1 hypothetical protein ACZ87_00798 [Candidatus Erwinia dacicola]